MSNYTVMPETHIPIQNEDNRKGNARRRWVRRLRAAAAFLFLLILVYVFVDWQGHRDWRRYVQRMRDQGISLELSDYLAKPVPDDENFATTPFIAAWEQNLGISILTNDLYAKAGNYVWGRPNTKNRGQRHYTDLVAWSMAYRQLQKGLLKEHDEFNTDSTSLDARAAAAVDVLKGMEPDAAVFAELRAANSHPYFRYTVNYDVADMTQPSAYLLPNIKALCTRLQLETCAELAVGKTDQALADERVMLRLADSLGKEPFAISFLVRIACFNVSLTPIWEGLAEHRWTDQQLTALQTQLQSYNFFADLDFALRTEEIFAIREVAQMQAQGLGIVDDAMALENPETDSDFHKHALNFIGRFLPPGWYDEERFQLCSVYDQQMSGATGTAERRVYPQVLVSNYARLAAVTNSSGQYPILAVLRHKANATSGLWVLVKTTQRAAIEQTLVNEAAIACALEKHRLANGEYPEALSVLSPDFMGRLPIDVINGQPYSYRRTSGRQFVLASVGWKSTPPQNWVEALLDEDRESDWVWRYPDK